MADPPTKLLVGISGFLETERRPSGIEDILWQVFSEIEHVATARFLWSDSIVTMVRLVRRIVEKWPSIEVNILGYSYGGSTATQLVDALRPIAIANLFLIDPVWRPFRHFPSFLSIYGMGTLWVEANVERCHVWRQRTTIIRGCKVARRADLTTLWEDTINRRHSQIDNSTHIKGAIIERLAA